MNELDNSLDFNTKIPINIHIKQSVPLKKHWHDYLEIIYVLDGTITVEVQYNIYSLKEDQLLFINPKEQHLIFSQTGNILVLHINLDYFATILPPSPSFHCNCLESTDASFVPLKRIIAKLLFHWHHTQQYEEIILNALAYELLFELCTNYRVLPSETQSTDQKIIDRLTVITEYIKKYYKEPLTLKEVANIVYLSPTYLSHFLDKHLGMTFFQYLTRIRLYHAVTQLQSTNLSIEQLSQENGFSNSRYFVQAFKAEFQLLPKDYRKSYHNALHQNDNYINKPAKENAIPHYLKSLLQYYVNDQNTLSTSSASLFYHCNIQTTSPMKQLSHSFRSMIPVNSPLELLNPKTKRLIFQLQKEFHFQYLKLHGILDDSLQLYQFREDGEDFLYYNHLDQILDFLVSIQIKPFLTLSPMPSVLQSDSSLSLESRFLKWKWFLTELLHHLNKRYGHEEVHTWLFNFWDLPSTEYSTPKEPYEINLQFYQIAYHTLKQLAPQLQFGSPSFFLCKHSFEQTKCLILDCIQLKCIPDFYDFQLTPFLSSHENTRKRLLQLKADLSDLSPAPIYVTEGTRVHTHKSWLYDTCYFATLMLSRILDCYDMIDCFCNWCITSSHVNMEYSNQEFCNDVSLFTNHFVKKPSYYAISYLSNLEDKLVSKGEHYYITTDGYGRYSILLYNFVPLSDTELSELMSIKEHEHQYHPFPLSKSVTLNLALQGLYDGTYTMTEQIVNQEFGSCYDVWIHMGSFELELAQEIECLQGLSQPFYKKSTVTIDYNHFNYIAKLQPYEIRFITLEQSPNTKR